MGWFSQGLDEEFVIGAANVRRSWEDPNSLDEIPARQHARGFDSPRALREVQRDCRTARGLDHVGQAAAAVGLGLLLAHFWTGHHGD